MDSATQTPLFTYEEPKVEKSNPVRTELERLNAAAMRVLAFLQERGEQGAYNYEICKPEIGGLEGTRRIRELRKNGYLIDHVHIEGGTWRYTLR